MTNSWIGSWGWMSVFLNSICSALLACSWVIILFWIACFIVREYLKPLNFFKTLTIGLGREALAANFCYFNFLFFVYSGAISTVSAYFLNITSYFWGIFFFSSFLTITAFTDALTLLISPLVTLYLVPLVFLVSYFDFLPITLVESVLGFCLGYMLLYLVYKTSKYLLGREGLGSGDIDLLAFIGALTGPYGCWFVLLLGSVLGSLAGIWFLLTGHKREELKLPFGMFLVFGYFLYSLLESVIQAWFMLV